VAGKQEVPGFDAQKSTLRYDGSRHTAAIQGLGVAIADETLVEEDARRLMRGL
jgi:hypothetical protein